MVTIRPEETKDYPTVRKVNELAFEDSTEASLVEALRSEADPYISLVAVENGEVIGHIFFSPVSIENPGETGLALGLAPMAVKPFHQRQGVGSLLVTQGLKEGERLGAEIVVVLGHRNYYPRFGFRPAAEVGLACEYDVAPEEFMTLELKEGALKSVSGLVRYHKAFSTL